MPNIKSAKKRVLVNNKKNAENRMEMTQVKNAIKRINNAIDTNNIDEAEKMLPEIMSVLDKAVSKGIMHKNTAANKKSGIAKRLADIKSGKKTVVIKKDNKTIAAEKAKARTGSPRRSARGNRQKERGEKSRVRGCQGSGESRCQKAG